MSAESRAQIAVPAPRAAPDPAGAAFGCILCWPADAEAAWAARSGLVNRRDLIDESHFHVMVLSCPKCGQAYVSVFTESIDWADGDDPQEWTTLPLTADEAGRLVRNEPPTEAVLSALGPGRRCLRRDAPKGAPPRAFWHTGLAIGWHD